MPAGPIAGRPKRAVRVAAAFGGRTRSIAAALLAVAVAALVVASAWRTERPVDATPAQRASHESWPRAFDGKARPQISRVDAEIEALADAIARKYRISHAATREFVSTAYREGSGIGVDPLLIIAVMAIESRFNPIAQSAGGALGLMQVMPRYHADKLAHGASMLDPQANIRLGARVLRDYIRRGGNDAAGLQLYNGASGDASNAYANRVLGERQRLRETARRGREANRA